MNARRITLGLACSACLLLSGGCLISSSNSVEESGIKITDSTLNRIEIGKTSEAWLRATLGDPNQVTEVADTPGLRVLCYDHIVSKRGKGAVFLIFAGSSSSEKSTRTYFEIQNGFVSKFWVEH